MDRFTDRDARRDSSFAEPPRRRNRSRSAERDEDERALRRGDPPLLPGDRRGAFPDRGPPPPRRAPVPPPRGGAPIVDDRFVDADDDSEDERPPANSVPVPPPAPLPPPEHRKLELPAGVDDDEAMMRLLGFSGAFFVPPSSGRSKPRSVRPFSQDLSPQRERTWQTTTRLPRAGPCARFRRESTGSTCTGRAASTAR